MAGDPSIRGDSGVSFSNISFVSKTVRGRSNGDDMETYSGYTSRSDGTSERTGQNYRFSSRDDLSHHEILYPRDATRFPNAQTMWQAVNAVERHPRAQFAYEVVLPLTANPDVGLHHHIAMVREFAEWYRVQHGVPVQIDIHGANVAAGAVADGSGEDEEAPANPHAHLLMPTRVLRRDGFGEKTRHLNPPFYRGRVMEEEYLRQMWAGIQQRYGVEHGLDVHIEPTGFVPQPHLGPLSCRTGKPELANRLALVRSANAAAACDPAQVLLKLTEHNATFTEDDVEALIKKHLVQPAEVAEQVAAVLASDDLIALNDRQSGDWSGRYTTRQVRRQEQNGMDSAAALAAQLDGEPPAHAVHAALAKRPLLSNAADQRAAFDYVVAPGKLKIIEGRAGTGKSYTLAAIREAFEERDRQGKPQRRVIGLSHMHFVKEEMKADGFAEAYTVSRMLSLLRRSEGAIWNGVGLVAIDEAAMLSTAQFAGSPATSDEAATQGLLYWAERTGTKIVLVGDDRQLPSIERGGLFTELVERHGSRVLTSVRRQRIGWQREAAKDLADYKFEKAIQAFDTDRTPPFGAAEPSRIAWRKTKTKAIEALVEAWKADGEAMQDGAPDPIERQFVFAFTHREVDALNVALRQVRRDSGRRGAAGLRGADVPLDVCYREPAPGEREDLHLGIPFAVGDRIQFTRNDERKGIFNGNLATITDIQPAKDAAGSWNLTAAVETAQGKKTISWNSDATTADGFNGIRHGYAGTGWKGQGRTIDQTYSLFSRHWTAPLSYMMLTRQRENTRLFVASPGGRRDRAWLAEQMSRRTVTNASLAWEAAPRHDRDRAAGAEDHRLERQRNEVRPPMVGGVPRVAIDVAAGRAQFRAKVARRQEARDEICHGIVAEWDARQTAFEASLHGTAGNAAASVAAREQFAVFADRLATHDWLPSALEAEASKFGLPDRPELARVIEAKDARAAIALLMMRLEQAHHARQRPNGGRPRIDERSRTHRGSRPARR